MAVIVRLVVECIWMKNILPFFLIMRHPPCHHVIEFCRYVTKINFYQYFFITLKKSLCLNKYIYFYMISLI